MNNNLIELDVLRETPRGGVDLSRNENFVKRILPPLQPDLCPSKYPSSEELKFALADKHSVDVGQIILGNGITDLLHVCARACINQGDIVDVGLATYLPACYIFKQAGAIISPYPSGSIRFLVNPNNPTGEFTDPHCYNLDDYEITIVDEAYIDYYPEKPSFIDNLSRKTIVLRTFSKLHGLAGMRIGYGIASKDVSDFFQKAEQKYPLSVAAINAALHSLRDELYLERSIHENEISMTMLVSGLVDLSFEHLPPCANFVVAKIPVVSGFQLRDLGAYTSMKGWKRITTAETHIMNAFLNKLGDCL